MTHDQELRNAIDYFDAKYDPLTNSHWAPVRRVLSARASAGEGGEDYKCVWPNCACDHPSKHCENAAAVRNRSCKVCNGSEKSGWGHGCGPIGCTTATATVTVHGIPDDVVQLMQFYDVASLVDLARAQTEHVTKLQAKLPPTPDYFPRTPRVA